MSYDLYQFKPEAGVDPLETVERLFFEESEEINPGPPRSEKEKRKRALADALIKLNPKFPLASVVPNAPDPRTFDERYRSLPDTPSLTIKPER